MCDHRPAPLLPDPTVQGNSDKLLAGPDMIDAFGGQLALDISQLRATKVTHEGTEASQRQVRLDLAWAEWRTAGQGRLLGARILTLQRQLGIARESAMSAETLLTAASGDVDARRQAALDSADKARPARARRLAALRASCCCWSPRTG